MQETTKLPRSATHYLPNKDGSIALFYKWVYTKCNDNTIAKGLSYLSTCGGGWMGSMERNPENFMKERLLPL